MSNLILMLWMCWTCIYTHTHTHTRTVPFVCHDNNWPPAKKWDTLFYMAMAELGIQIIMELRLLENDRQFTVLEKIAVSIIMGLMRGKIINNMLGSCWELITAKMEAKLGHIDYRGGANWHSDSPYQNFKASDFHSMLVLPKMHPNLTQAKSWTLLHVGDIYKSI